MLGSGPRVALVCGAAIALVAAQLRPPARSDSPVDVVIRHGRIVDGTGAPWYFGDIAIRDGKITAIGKLDVPGKRVLDASGMVVAPGFIDMLGQSEFNLLVDNRAASKILQGVTTEITGEGSSIAPLSDRMIREGGVRNGKTPFDAFHVVADWHTLSDYFKRLEERVHPAINIGTFVAPAASAVTSSEGMTASQRPPRWSR